MKNYLTKILDWKKNEVAIQYDELPLWSSPFGLLLMDNFPIGDYENYLDIGFGTGFPLVEISQRIGSKCNAYGIDLWESGYKRAKSKIETYGLKNITLLQEDASNISFPDDYFDLITSNLGINNFANPSDVISECFRVIKKDASLCITTNLIGTFDVFYNIYLETLIDLDMTQYVSKLEEHIKHRGTRESTMHLIKDAGFKISKQVESKYQMRFLNGSAFLNHSFIIIGFIDTWRNMFDESDKILFFDKFEKKLNDYSIRNGELNLTIPMVYFECKK